MNRGSAILVAAAAAALVLPLTAFGLDLPLWIGGALSAGVFGGLYLIVRRPKGGEGLDEDALEDARGQLVCYAVAGSNGLDLEKYSKRKVDLYGTSSYSQELRANVVSVSRVDALK